MWVTSGQNRKARNTSHLMFGPAVKAVDSKEKKIIVGNLVINSNWARQKIIAILLISIYDSVYTVIIAL